MLQVKPHSVTVAPVDQIAAGNLVMGNPAAGSASPAIACLCAALKPMEAFQMYGVALTNAWKVYIEASDAASFAPQSRITFNGITYWQQGDVELHQTGDLTDCGIVYMTQNQYPVIT